MNEGCVSVHKELPQTAIPVFSSDRKLVERFRIDVQCVAVANCTHRLISDVMEVNAEI